MGVGQKIDHTLVEVFATEKGISVGRQHFELLFAIDIRDFDNRNIEGATTQVVHGDLGIRTLLIHTVRQRGSGRLIDNAFHI